eukprot:12426751-Karenia_brevis.AAC.1
MRWKQRLHGEDERAGQKQSLAQKPRPSRKKTKKGKGSDDVKDINMATKEDGGKDVNAVGTKI